MFKHRDASQSANAGICGQAELGSKHQPDLPGRQTPQATQRIVETDTAHHLRSIKVSPHPLPSTASLPQPAFDCSEYSAQQVEFGAFGMGSIEQPPKPPHEQHIGAVPTVTAHLHYSL